MTRVYYAPIESATVSASGDLWQITTTSSTKARLLGWEITSNAIAAEALEIKLVRATTAGSGGTAMDENPADPADSAATVIGLVTNSTPASTLVDLQFFAWEQLGPVGMVYTPEMAPIMGVSSSMVLVLTTTPTSFEMSGWVAWEEL